MFQDHVGLVGRRPDSSYRLSSRMSGYWLGLDFYGMARLVRWVVSDQGVIIQIVKGPRDKTMITHHFRVRFIPPTGMYVGNSGMSAGIGNATRAIRQSEMRTSTFPTVNNQLAIINKPGPIGSRRLRHARRFA